MTTLLSQAVQGWALLIQAYTKIFFQCRDVGKPQKNNFFYTYFPTFQCSNVPMVIKLKGGGVNLNGAVINRRPFNFVASRSVTLTKGGATAKTAGDQQWRWPATRSTPLQPGLSQGVWGHRGDSWGAPHPALPLVLNIKLRGLSKGAWEKGRMMRTTPFKVKQTIKNKNLQNI